MGTYNKFKYFQELTEKLQEKLSSIMNPQLINLTTEELEAIIEAMGDYTTCLADTYGDELYHEQRDLM